jgi:4-hydroxy-tetrahydrodipicolinate synthase
VNFRVPVIVGVSSPGFASMAKMAAEAMAAGATAVMVAPQHGLRGDERIFDYFAQVREHIGQIPFVLQDHPQSTGVPIGTDLLGRIISAHPSCIMLKHEDWPGLGKITALRQAESRGQLRRISILGGNGGLFLPEELARGTDGVMTGFAFPEMMVDVCRAHRAHATTRMRDVFDAYLPLARYEQQPGIGLAVRKHILLKRGAIASATLRMPRSALSAVDVAEIEQLIHRQAIRLEQLG